jgi:isopenicillin-N N-acyltransferase-like protein
MFLHTSKLDWKAVREVAKEYAGPIERLTPDLYAEMQGIADGAGLELMDIVALNCRSEIALGHFSDGCTSLGWKTQKEGVILAQNWDWTEPVKRNLVLMSIARPGYPKIFMITEVRIPYLPTYRLTFHMYIYTYEYILSQGMLIKNRLASWAKSASTPRP